MTLETGDKTYETRLERYAEMKKLRDAGATYENIGKTFPSPDGKPLTRQAIFKILARDGVKPAGRPRGSATLPVVSGDDLSPHKKSRAAIEAKIEDWHRKLLSATEAGSLSKMQRAQERLADLHRELLAAE